MPTGMTVALVLLVPLSWWLWGVSVRLAASRASVTTPDGRKFDVLVHRQGVMLYTRKAAALNAYSVFPALWAVLRRRTNNPWAVTVRQAPFAGYPNLLHEVIGPEEAARQRAGELVAAVRAGEDLWDRTREM